MASCDPRGIENNCNKYVRIWFNPPGDRLSWRTEPLSTSSTAIAGKTTSGRHPGRQELPPHLPRVERIIACTPEQCACQIRGKDKAVIGYEQSEHPDVEPARYFVIVTRREKRACRSCAERVSAAPLPVQRLSSAVPAERDSGAGHRRFDRPGGAGRMDPAGRRDADTDGGGDATRVGCRKLPPGG
jgi:hypothetical protein